MDGSISIDADWLNQQVKAYESRRPDFERHSELLKAVLAWTAAPVCPTAIVLVRAKAVGSFAGKIIKRIQAIGKMPETTKMQYELTPDLSAGKIVSSLPRQVNELEERLKLVLEATQRRSAEADLTESQFGYRATHVIGKLKTADFSSVGFFDSPWGKPFAGMDLSPLAILTCEVQLVTLAQYLWDTFTHDRQYKSDFVLPRVWSRTSYRLAAVLEGVDEGFEQIVDGLSLLETNVGRYLDQAEATAEAERLEAVVRWTPTDFKLLARLVRTQTLLGRFDAVIDRLEKSPIPLTARLKSELGYALCCRGTSTPADFNRGIALLEESCRQVADVETLTRLADLSQTAPAMKRELWRNAYTARPTDPTALAGFLRHEMTYSHSDSVAQLLCPNIAAARKILIQQIDLQINLPWAFYLLVQFELIQGDPYMALNRLCQGLSLTPPGGFGDKMLDEIRLNLSHFSDIRPEPLGLQWCIWTIELARAVRNTKAGRFQLPVSMSNLAGNPVSGAVLIVAGGCDHADINLAAFGPLLEFAVTDFAGTFVSGGTLSGISKMVGDLIEKKPSHRRGFAWLPPDLPAGTQIDDRYTDSRKAESGVAGFSPAEPLRSWITLLSSGIQPRDVTLLGFNGGRIAAFEYHLAAILGARVGVIRATGRAADDLLLEEDKPGNESIHFLPADRETLRAFIDPPSRSGFTDKELKLLAEQADATYHEVVHTQTRKEWDATLAADPSLARTFSTSNINQVEQIPVKLARLGLKMVKAAPPIDLITFADYQIELLAEMEHGRWVTERTLDSWKLGPGNLKKHRPQLVSWTDPALPESEKEKDRAAVRAIPKMLATAGYAIVSA